MFSISNKHEEFFDYLMTNAENFHRGALIAHEVMEDVSTISMHLKEIVKLEHTSDKTNQKSSSNCPVSSSRLSTGKIFTN